MGGRPGSSRRACSPAGTTQQKYKVTVTTGSWTCAKSREQAGLGPDLDLLLKQVDLVLLLYQLLLLLGDLRHKIYVN